MLSHINTRNNKKQGEGVFVLIMSDTCGACQLFKKNKLANLRKRLEREPVDLVEIELTGNNKSQLDQYHPDLKRWVAWFPIMLLFPKNLWNDKTGKLDGAIKNGRMTAEGVKNIPTDNKPVDYSDRSVIKWVHNNLGHPHYHNTNNNTNNNNSVLDTSDAVILLTDNGERVTLDELDNLPEGTKVVVPTKSTNLKFINQRLADRSN